MGRNKKLTVKIYSNNELKKETSNEVSSVNDKPLKYYPLYIAVSYGGKNTKLKSPTYEMISKYGYSKSILNEDHESIRLNDLRFIDCIKTKIENNFKRDFTVSDINSSSISVLKKPIIELFSMVVKTFFILPGNEFIKINNLEYTKQFAINTSNMANFLTSMSELNKELANEFEREYPGWIKLAIYLIELEKKRIYPFAIEIFDLGSVLKDDNELLKGSITLENEILEIKYFEPLLNFFKKK